MDPTAVIPEQQGLKLIRPWLMLPTSSSPTAVIPEQQGLKQQGVQFPKIPVCPTAVIPEQQGLKPSRLNPFIPDLLPHSGNSRTTRIET